MFAATEIRCVPPVETFYRAQRADPVFSVQQELDAIRPNGSSAGQDGLFYIIADAGSGVPPVTVYYRLSGTASNGVDYTFLTGSVSITNTAAGNFTPFYVHPLANATNFLDQTVTLTLNPGPGYLVEPGADSATLTIIANLFTVVTNLDTPVGMDYDPFNQSLLVSYNYNYNTYSGPTNNFSRFYTNASTGGLIINNWSGIQGLQDEVKLAVVKQTANGFTNGEMYFGTGVNGVIGKLSADGTVSNLNWCILTNDLVVNALPLRGSLYVDQTGGFSNQLIAVTSDSTATLSEKGVWRVDSQRHPTLITNINTRHLEGVITLTNDPAKWGPWAGMILTGDEDENILYAINTNGVVMIYDTTTMFPGGIGSENFNIIPTNQDLYCAGQPFGSDTGAILRLSKSLFKNFVGDLLIT